jgi:hypothetical protein
MYLFDDARTLVAKHHGDADGRVPVTKCLSEPQTPAATMRSRTSPSPGGSSSSVSTVRGSPARCRTAARGLHGDPPVGGDACTRRRVAGI